LIFAVAHAKEGAFIVVVVWFANPARIAYHLAGKSVKAAVVPILRIVLGIIVKRVLGLNKECRGKPSQLFLLRQFISSKLLSQGRLRDAFAVLGSHYENVSVSITPNTSGALADDFCRSSIVPWVQRSEDEYTGQELESTAWIPSFWR